MAGGPSKINPPNSHPSNPIHKAATAESGRGIPGNQLRPKLNKRSHRRKK